MHYLKLRQYHTSSVEFLLGRTGTGFTNDFYLSRFDTVKIHENNRSKEGAVTVSIIQSTSSKNAEKRALPQICSQSA